MHQKHESELKGELPVTVTFMAVSPLTRGWSPRILPAGQSLRAVVPAAGVVAHRNDDTRILEIMKKTYEAPTFTQTELSPASFAGQYFVLPPGANGDVTGHSIVIKQR